MNMRLSPACILIVVLLSMLLYSSECNSAGFSYIDRDELASKIGSSDLTILDVRPLINWMFSFEKIKGAIREDPGKVRTWQSKYAKDSTLVLYCQTDVTSSGVAQELLFNGFQQVYVLKGGWTAWSQAKLPTEKK